MEKGNGPGAVERAEGREKRSDEERRSHTIEARPAPATPARHRQRRQKPRAELLAAARLFLAPRKPPR